MRAVAALGDVARPCCRTAHVRFLDVGRTRNVGAGAGLGRVASAGRDPTHGAHRLERIRRAVIVRAVAALGDVARAGRRAAHVGSLHVGRASGGRAGARLGDVAGAGGGAALGSRRLEGVARARVVRPVAALGNITGTRRRTADVRPLRVRRAGAGRAGAGFRGVTDVDRRAALGAGGLEGVGRARVVAAVAALRRVARACHRAADIRPLGVGGTGGSGAGAGLGDVADPRGCAALDARGLEGVDRTRIVRPVAPLLDIARTCRGTAEVALLLHVGRAGQAGAVAGLGDVTGAAGSPAHRARGLETVGRTGVVRAVAALLGVARAGGGPADVGPLRVGRAGGARSRARVGRVAHADRRSADGGGGLERIGGARVVRAVAALLDVTRTGHEATDARPLRVWRAGGARAGAELGRVAGAGRRAARGRRRLEGVGRAVVVRPVAALDRVAGSGRRTADTGLLLVAGARRHRAAADLGHVARARGRTALGARSLEAVYGTRVVRAVAGLGDVA